MSYQLILGSGSSLLFRNDYTMYVRSGKFVIVGRQIHARGLTQENSLTQYKLLLSRARQDRCHNKHYANLNGQLSVYQYDHAITNAHGAMTGRVPGRPELEYVLISIEMT